MITVKFLGSFLQPRLWRHSSRKPSYAMVRNQKRILHLQPAGEAFCASLQPLFGQWYDLRNACGSVRSRLLPNLRNHCLEWRNYHNYDNQSAFRTQATCARRFSAVQLDCPHPRPPCQDQYHVCNSLITATAAISTTISDSLTTKTAGWKPVRPPKALIAALDCCVTVRAELRIRSPHHLVYLALCVYIDARVHRMISIDALRSFEAFSILNSLRVALRQPQSPLPELLHKAFTRKTSRALELRHAHQLAVACCIFLITCYTLNVSAVLFALSFTIYLVVSSVFDIVARTVTVLRRTMRHISPGSAHSTLHAGASVDRRARFWSLR